MEKLPNSEEHTHESSDSMERFLETKPLIESVAKINIILENLRAKGIYGGENIDINKNFTVRRFPDLVGASGHSITSKGHVEFIPLATYSPKTIIHESLHLVSNWRFIETNANEDTGILKSGFVRAKKFDSAHNAHVPEQEFRFLNEGFTDFFARKFASGIEDQTEAHKEEVLDLCRRQYDEEIANDSRKIDELKLKGFVSEVDSNRLRILEENIAYLESSKTYTLKALEQQISSYDIEVDFVKKYLYQRALRMKALASENLEDSDITSFENRVFDEALEAYVNGEIEFLTGIDEIFGVGVLDKLKSAKSEFEFKSHVIMHSLSVD